MVVVSMEAHDNQLRERGKENSVNVEGRTWIGVGMVARQQQGWPQHLMWVQLFVVGVAGGEDDSNLTFGHKRVGGEIEVRKLVMTTNMEQKRRWCWKWWMHAKTNHNRERERRRRKKAAYLATTHCVPRESGEEEGKHLFACGTLLCYLPICVLWAPVNNYGCCFSHHFWRQASDSPKSKREVEIK